MDCPYCGAENPEGSEYCNLCLERFAQAPSPPAPGIPGPRPVPSPGPPGQSVFSRPEVKGDPADEYLGPRFDPSFYDPDYGRQDKE